MALLRPGRCCSRPQGGGLQHRTEAQRRPKGQHAGGTPALPGDTVPAVPCGSFEEKRPIVNEDEPRMDTNRPEDRWTSFNDKRHQHASATCALGVTMSWDDGFLGARASRPHQAWHSLGHLLHRNQPAAAPWLSFGLADGVPAHRVAACSIALKLSGGQRDKYAGGTPALPGDKEQDAGGTPALPGDAVPAVPGGSFEEKRPIVNEDEPRMNTNGHE